MLTTFNYLLSEITSSIPIIIDNIIIKENEIQIGDNTHNQDQSITFVNFNTIKVIVNAPENPIPERFEILSNIIKKI